ncbi:preprotein translocase subunit YajC [Pediococcus claussenii]|uniref:Preprotein translocase, YajC subunit n=1 Tax=Pediococcus claussenii (strain ATCC BAA-344 / DSM 14800 / JCM 18046 / KCTC 3811 / LMG 21948 / P06) TaxID=701521 RepID=G8PCM4_PEDCP|nr:preprotein translocase subunit YajC [Pediococcus claussenii]AEV95009.1 preprotein translocase, YajC subunit [Pediococcus claussenii ATCC BAA-344]ANZ70198.1 preprotein translocase subunit YajC [Pediococcus claussenii]ANZ72014.1 preprotein translocase subunit YajC [Pediococcus claussenii]KRN19189.1 yajC protein [Pediococcus claussenii]
MLLAAANGFGGMSTIVFFILIFGLMYFMMIRPQRKQQQKRQEMMNKLNVGDRVVTIGRLHGVVDAIDDTEKTVTLDCDGVYLVFDRTAIMRVDREDSTEKVPNQASEKPVESSDEDKDHQVEEQQDGETTTSDNDSEK